VTRRFLLSPEAESDLDDIKQWVLAEAGPAIALYVLRSLLKAIRMLAHRPDLGHPREVLTDLPLRLWPVFSYLIVLRTGAASD
jgi:toxin ParE1/3/4